MDFINKINAFNTIEWMKKNNVDIKGIINFIDKIL
jgi:hypothetical protein